MSNTPKTDELEFEIQGDYVVLSDECRQLERKNARLMALLIRAFPIIARHAPVSPILADIAKELPDE